MRILHVVEATIAGVRTHVQVITAGLDQRRFQSVVACPLRRENACGDDQFVNYLTSVGIPIVPVAMRRSIHPRADFAALRRLVGVFQSQRFDVIHLHSSKAGFLGRLAARIAGGSAPVVYSPHGLSFLGDQAPAKRRFYLALERIAGRMCDRIIAVSASERQIIAQVGLISPGRIVQIENGIAPIALPVGFDRSAMRRALGQLTDAPLIGTVARLSTQKNPRLFLDAAAQVLRDQPAARFVWCGGGELHETASSYARELGIADACCFLGHRNDAHQVLAALDCFWLTSDYEGLPLAPLEAMALRVPIVATDVVGTRDLLASGAGLLVPCGAASALAAATIRLTRAPERAAALAAAGYAYYRANGTAERMISALEQLYCDLVAERRRFAAVAPEALP
ncbi:MAG: glycosyltransferase family 4 protein [Roseiflexaceae bacterium]